jgi:hypothetical protein
MKQGETDPDLGIGKGNSGERDATGPLDGSTSGTIGGGGPQTGGPTTRSGAPDIPSTKPEDAASGRRAPDPLGATAEPDELGSGPSDVQRR